MAEIRGIYVDKLAKTYFKEALIFRNEVEVYSTPSREIRWYSKTSGYLTVSSPAKVGGIAMGALPFVAETSWTRTTSYVKKYMLDSPLITIEDETDNDVQVFRTAVEETTQRVAYQVDSDIWDVVTESRSVTNINSVTATAAWDAGSGQNPPEDIFEAVQDIREQTKTKVDAKLYVSAKGEKDLKTWVVTNGSNFTEAASKMVNDGNLIKFCGLPVVVSETVTADYALVADLKKACEYREFTPITTAIITEEGVGRKVRVWTHGIALLVRPKYCALISNTEA